MIISKTPYRVSFFGGGTDYPEWYRDYGGQVLATTIDKFVYVSCRHLPPFFEHHLRLVYSRIEMCQNIDELEHPTAREVLRYLNVHEGVEIHYDGDLPARSGVGSSSAFTVGLLNAAATLTNRVFTAPELAKRSAYIEQEVVKERVGSQDQVSAAYGGFNKIEFEKDGEILVRPVRLTRERIEELDSRLMLFFTGISRTAATVAETYVADIKSHQNQLCRMYDMVDEAIKLLSDPSGFDEFGSLLHETWLEKRSLSDMVTNNQIDEIYESARSAGALGGKLTGAGGGGMLLFYVPIENQAAVKSRLSGLVHIPFKFEASGSQIIYQDAET